ncbi:hypothetical protein AC1031_014340 [Aphanomyces cochlioides]|nr:hypothetical protein AC1031_014340 [Aphanomyces cochlioides]
MLLRLVVVLGLFHCTAASLFSGFLLGREFAYLGKFCYTWDANFSKIVGNMHIEIRTPDDDVKLAIYDDEDEFWSFVTTNPNCDCQCKLSEAHTKAVFDVPRATHWNQTFKLDYGVREHLRPRFWYVALAKCVSDGERFHPSLADLSPATFLHFFFTAWYSLHMTQAVDGSEVPVYQEDLDVVYLFLTCLSGLVLLLQLHSAATSRLRSESFHPIVQLLTFLVSLHFANNIALCLNFFSFAWNGIGSPLLLCLARVGQALNRVGMLLLAMLIAKGWTINSIHLEDRTLLTTVMVAILTLYLGLAGWYLGFVPPASTIYMFDSVPGFAICLLHFAVYIWFLRNICTTAAKEQTSDKRTFFFQMSLLFTFYILSLPMIVSIATFLSPWVRQKIVESVASCIEFTTLTVLVYFLWPSRAPHYFDRLYSLVGSQTEKTTLCDSSLPTNQL